MTDDLGTIPFVTSSPFIEPDRFAAVRSLHGIPRMRTSTGDLGWLVSRYDDARALCADPRIGRSHTAPERAPRLWHAALFPPQSDPRQEMRQHRAWRSRLAPRFGRRSVAAWRPRVQAWADETVDDLIAAGPPADACALVAMPFSLRVILDFFGIPYADAELFHQQQTRARCPDPAEYSSTEMYAYLEALLDRKRRRPGDDAMSDLAAIEGAPRIRAMGSGFIDHTTIALRIGYGLLFLLADPAQRDLLWRTPGLLPSAVEEILRVAVPGGSWIPRYALADIEHGQTQMSAGDLVVFAFESINRDERIFPDPGRFAIDRDPNPHIAFGYGKFYCLASHLSRLMLEVILATLIRRLPGLRLAVAPEEVEVDRESVTGGLLRLPVTW
ncbi:cytochrome P450 [Streptosporangiaceae bacterium NEAU-GS5]|nr:cytochrome P450 [Streptosporangiaceae bacterium NEAU-GS5]